MNGISRLGNNFMLPGQTANTRNIGGFGNNTQNAPISIINIGDGDVNVGSHNGNGNNVGNAENCFGGQQNNQIMAMMAKMMAMFMQMISQLLGGGQGDCGCGCGQGGFNQLGGLNLLA